MRSHQRNTQPGRGEHHDRFARVPCYFLAAFCEELGMAAEGDAGVIDNRLLYRRCHDGVCLSLQTGIAGQPEHVQHVSGIGRVCFSGCYRGFQLAGQYRQVIFISNGLLDVID